MTNTTSGKDMQKGKELKMKKQDNESLIQELTKRLDWYTMEASEEEFDAEQVQALMKLLDSLKSEEENKIEEELPVEEAVSDFWQYYEEREEEEKLLFDYEEKENSDSALIRGTEQEEHKESKFRRVLWFFHRHRFAVVTAAVLVVIMLGGSWQVVANAEKHGGFFWWMDKNEEGTTMITSPEGATGSDSSTIGIYDSMEEIPDEYKNYVEQLFEIPILAEWELDYAKIIKGTHNDSLYVFMNSNDDSIEFQIKMYPQEILRVREKYPGYIFEREFENEGIIFDVFSKKEIWGENTYLMYFYYDKEKYIVLCRMDEERLQDIVIQYKNVILNSY